MQQNPYKLHLPEDASPGHCIATFSTVITFMAIELGTYFDGQMSAKYGAGWFDQLEDLRASQKPAYRKSKSCFDFSWVVNEPTRNQDSPLREFLPKNEYQFYPAMRDILDTRNRWYHDFNPHNISELSKALNLVRYIAEKCNLLLADELKPIIARVQAIKAGSYRSVLAEALPTPARAGAETNLRKALRQAAVGAAWLGDLGKQKLQLTSGGSIMDIGAAKNVTNQSTEAQLRYLNLWKYLSLDWLWVDDAGSVAAYVAGSLRMVGYFGPNAKDEGQDPFSKFLIQATYSLSEGNLIHRESQKILDQQNIGRVTQSTLKRANDYVDGTDVLRLTWDGDLIHFGDGGPDYIGEIESEDWFAGHFFIPTPKE